MAYKRVGKGEPKRISSTSRIVKCIYERFTPVVAHEAGSSADNYVADVLRKEHGLNVDDVYYSEDLKRRRGRHS